MVGNTTTDNYIKLVVSSLDYSREGVARTILAKALKVSSDVRHYHLAFTVHKNAPNTVLTRLSLIPLTLLVMYLVITFCVYIYSVSECALVLRSDAACAATRSCSGLPAVGRRAACATVV